MNTVMSIICQLKKLFFICLLKGFNNIIVYKICLSEWWAYSDGFQK